MYNANTADKSPFTAESINPDSAFYPFTYYELKANHPKWNKKQIENYVQVLHGFADLIIECLENRSKRDSEIIQANHTIHDHRTT